MVSGRKETIQFKSKTLHDKEVEKLQKRLSKQKNCISLKSNAPSNTLRNKTASTEELDVASLIGVLTLNEEENWILVEPKITFFSLCKITLLYGLIPPVVPEFTSITVGGAIMGAALESSSHRFGQVSDNCLEYELLLGNGEKIYASKTLYSDLFYGISGSYGTLALLTAVKLKLIRAKKWVQLKLYRFENLRHMTTDLTEQTEDDYIEGIVFDRSNGVVIKGNLEDEQGPHPFRQVNGSSRWYVQHLAQTKHQQISMLLEEYLFRLDLGAFWMGRYVNDFSVMLRVLFQLRIPRVRKNSIMPSPFFRRLFGRFLRSEYLYKIWHRIPNHASQNIFLIQDFYAPSERAYETLDRFMRETAIFPIWLCPIKGTAEPQFLSPHYGKESFLNIGLYGIPESSHSIPELTAKLERDILQLGGRKMLYSFTYYEPEIFAAAYKEESYAGLRKKYGGNKVFPHLYEKVVFPKISSSAFHTTE